MTTRTHSTGSGDVRLVGTHHNHPDYRREQVAVPCHHLIHDCYLVYWHYFLVDGCTRDWVMQLVGLDNLETHHESRNSRRMVAVAV